jgi:hypothetical protein
MAVKTPMPALGIVEGAMNNVQVWAVLLSLAAYGGAFMRRIEVHKTCLKLRTDGIVADGLYSKSICHIKPQDVDVVMALSPSLISHRM